MSQVTAEKAASANTQSFITALVVNSALLLVEVGAFTILQQHFKRVYSPRTYLPPPEYVKEIHFPIYVCLTGIQQTYRYSTARTLEMDICIARKSISRHCELSYFPSGVETRVLTIFRFIKMDLTRTCSCDSFACSLFYSDFISF